MNRLFFFLFLLITGNVFAQPVNTLLSKGLLFESEPYLAINPTNPQNIIVAWMSGRLLGNPVTIVTRMTSDGGATWNDTLSLPHMNSAWQSADVSMAWRSDGVLFISYIDYQSNSNTNGGVFVVHSSDEGRSFSTPVKAIDATDDTDVSLDRPWIAIDNSSGATNGNLYISTKPAPWNPIPNHSYFTRSTDGGATWTPEAILDSLPYSAEFISAPMGSPTVSSDGTLYIAYPFSSSGAGFALAQSIDGGNNFTRSSILQPVEDFKEKDSIKGGFHIIADPTNPKHLLFAWPDARDGDYDVFSSVSFDAGASWSVPARVNDDPMNNGVVQDMIWPTFGPKGALAIVWRDRRNGSKPGYASQSDTYFATSSDGGKTWLSNVRLSNQSAPYDSVLEHPGNDFLSAAIVHDTLVAAWADTRSGRVKIYTARAALMLASSVNEINSQTNALSVVPNPSRSTVGIEFTLAKDQKCSIQLFDDRGRRIRSIAEDEFSSGTHTVQCPTIGLANGTYWIVLTIAEGNIYRAKLALAR